MKTQRKGQVIELFKSNSILETINFKNYLLLNYKENFNDFKIKINEIKNEKEENDFSPQAKIIEVGVGRFTYPNDVSVIYSIDITEIERSCGIIKQSFVDFIKYHHMDTEEILETFNYTNEEEFFDIAKNSMLDFYNKFTYLLAVYSVLKILKREDMHSINYDLFNDITIKISEVMNIFKNNKTFRTEIFVNLLDRFMLKNSESNLSNLRNFSMDSFNILILIEKRYEEKFIPIEFIAIVNQFLTCNFLSIAILVKYNSTLKSGLIEEFVSRTNSLKTKDNNYEENINTFNIFNEKVDSINELFITNFLLTRYIIVNKYKESEIDNFITDLSSEKNILLELMYYYGKFLYDNISKLTVAKSVFMVDIIFNVNENMIIKENKKIFIEKPYNLLQFNFETLPVFETYNFSFLNNILEKEMDILMDSERSMGQLTIYKNYVLKCIYEVDQHLNLEYFKNLMDIELLTQFAITKFKKSIKNMELIRNINILSKMTQIFLIEKWFNKHIVFNNEYEKYDLSYKNILNIVIQYKLYNTILIEKMISKNVTQIDALIDISEKISLYDYQDPSYFFDIKERFQNDILGFFSSINENPNNMPNNLNNYYILYKLFFMSEEEKIIDKMILDDDDIEFLEKKRTTSNFTSLLLDLDNIASSDINKCYKILLAMTMNKNFKGEDDKINTLNDIQLLKQNPIASLEDFIDERKNIMVREEFHFLELKKIIKFNNTEIENKHNNINDMSAESTRDESTGIPVNDTKVSLIDFIERKLMDIEKIKKFLKDFINEADKTPNIDENKEDSFLKVKQCYETQLELITHLECNIASFNEIEIDDRINEVFSNIQKIKEQIQ